MSDEQSLYEAIAQAVHKCLSVRKWEHAYPEDKDLAFEITQEVIEAIEDKGAKVLWREPTETVVMRIYPDEQAGFRKAWRYVWDAAPSLGVAVKE